MKTIPISQGKQALVDDQDYAALSQFKWTAQRRKYTFHAARYCGKVYVYMHRMILGTPKKTQVDHIDGNGLNNQRSNLRAASRLQNARAFRGGRPNKTSRFRGVHFHRKAEKWQATIVIAAGKNHYLGLFVEEEDAARAYDAAAKLHFGEFVHLNFP